MTSLMMPGTMICMSNTIDPSSPFASFKNAKSTGPSRIIHVNFCSACHHVWKAPAAATVCINCKGNGPTARSLVSYETEVPIT